jgi:hypothetical protein
VLVEIPLRDSSEVTYPSETNQKVDDFEGVFGSRDRVDRFPGYSANGLNTLIKWKSLHMSIFLSFILEMVF